MVDVFFIAESTVPFKPGAPPKPLHLKNHWNNFAKFHSKMVLVEIPHEISQETGAKISLEDWRPNFKIQEAQRDELWRQLKEKLDPQRDDLIVKADLDEIPKPAIIEQLACSDSHELPPTPICLGTGTEGFYYYNYRCHIKFEWTASPMIFQTHNADKNHQPYYHLPCTTQLTNASIHCSSCFGSLDDYHIKSISNSEPARNPLQTNNASILERVRTCKDFWLRTNLDFDMELRTSVDEDFIPQIVTKYPDRWPHLMGNGPLYESTMSVYESGLDAAAVITVSNDTVSVNVPICLTAQNSCVRPHFPNPEVVTCPAQGQLTETSTGAYILPENYAYRFDQKFANAILDNVISGRVLELGAGLGCYTYYFQDSGKLSNITGYEGASNVLELSKGLIKQADLAMAQDFGQYDWVLCLEVAEHIPKQYETTFVDNLIAPRPKGLILSWALPDQPGSGHVNGQSNSYVVALMQSKGYEYDTAKTELLREAAELGWFKQTTMVFVAPGGRAA